MSHGKSTSRTNWVSLRTPSQQATKGKTGLWSGVSIGDLREFLQDVDVVGLADDVQVRFQQESSPSAYACWNMEARHTVDIPEEGPVDIDDFASDESETE